MKLYTLKCVEKNLKKQLLGEILGYAPKDNSKKGK